MRSTRTFARAAAATVAAVAVMASLSPPALGDDPAEAAPAQNHDLALCPWMDTSLSADERANLLLDASTQHQKYRWLNEHAANSPQETTFSGVEYPAQVGCTPTVVYANGPEGVHGRAGTTAWPAPIAIAASWNLELNELKSAMHGSEAFDSGNAVILGPGIASGRHPLSGRTPEYFGEDALLSGLMGAAAVRGLEDGNPDKPVMANVKHFVANEQELDRELSSSNIDDRTLRQTYILPYEIAIAESDPDSLMCSYNQVNGVYACENPILTTDLRDRIGFEGYVMSDFGSVHSTADSLNAGLDQELNRPVWYTPELLDAALEAGEITQEAIDRAAFNVVRAYINTGLFDHPVPSPALTDLSTAEHKAVARQLAEQSTVLLKNDDSLPLDENLTVAVIGPTASLEETNGISAETACAAYLVFRQGPVLNCDALVDPLTSITETVEAAGGEVVFHNGADPDAAAAVAADADVAIVFGHLTTGEFADIEDINLDAGGDALISAVADVADETVVVVNSGTAFEMPWIDEVDAVLQGWYGGEQFGPAIAGILFGDVNPSGKLPMSFPVSLEDAPASTPEQYPGVFADGSTERPEGSTEIRQVNYTEGMKVGYKWYEAEGIAPQFPFGHGLSYTSYDYADLDVSTDVVDGEVTARVSFTVTNSGDVDGAEVPQVYLTLPDEAGEPAKRLVAFDRLDLAAGESAEVSFTLAESDSNRPFSIWDVDAADWATVEGRYEVSVGASSQDIRLSTDADVTDGPDATPSPTPTPTPTVSPTAAPTQAPTTPPATTGDLYTTPGLHLVNGRRWMTVCEPYSQTNRCHTYIWATQVHRVGDAYFQTNGWAFNTLTYAPSKRALWASNPLGNTGSWTAADGRQWRTECDTPATGRNGCRSYAMAKVIERTDVGYRTVEKWVVNNIVRFS